jgi:hypothetical protein
MTIAEDNLSPRTTWEGSTAPTNAKSRNPPELRNVNGGNDSPDAPDYADDMVNVVDFLAASRYIKGITSSSSFGIDYITMNMSEYVKMSSESRPKMVPLDTVVRGTSFIVATLSTMSLLTTAASGAIIIQPLFAIALIISCVGFYVMTIVKK